MPRLIHFHSLPPTLLPLGRIPPSPPPLFWALGLPFRPLMPHRPHQAPLPPWQAKGHNTRTKISDKGPPFRCIIVPDLPPLSPLPVLPSYLSSSHRTSASSRAIEVTHIGSSPSPNHPPLTAQLHPGKGPPFRCIVVSDLPFLSADKTALHTPRHSTCLLRSHHVAEG